MTKISINLEPETPTLDGRHLSEVMNLWMADCRRRLPEQTTKAYEHKLQYFFHWWLETGPKTDWELRQEHLEQYAVGLSLCKHKFTDRFLEWHTRKDCLRRLRQCLLWAWKRGYTGSVNCALWVPTNPEGSARLKKILPIDTMAKLMLGASASPYAVRNMAILAAFIGTGARRSEISGLQIEDLTFREDISGTMHIRNAKHVKNREVVERLACFDKVTGYYLMRWLNRRASEEDSPLTHGPLWISMDDEPLTGQGVYKTVALAGETANVEFAGLHDFRRTFITYWATKCRGESDYHLLRMQVGHAPQGTTARFYDLRSIDDIAQVFVSPMAEVVAAARRMKEQSKG